MMTYFQGLNVPVPGRDPYRYRYVHVDILNIEGEACFVSDYNLCRFYLVLPTLRLTHRQLRQRCRVRQPRPANL